MTDNDVTKKERQIKTRKLSLVIVAIAVVLGGASIAFIASRSTSPTVSHGGTVRDYVSFVDTLRAKGALVEPNGTVAQPFFAVKANVVRINGQSVQVFEYETDAAAKNDAQKVSRNGGMIGTAKPFWTGTPHFYRNGRLIAIYVGDDKKTLEVLNKTLGTQFAGR